MTKRLNWIADELDTLSGQGLLRELQTRESPPVAGMVQLDGVALVNFGSNDYLGLAADERLIDAVKHCSGQHGWGAGGSSLVNGRGTLHRRLEQEIARFKKTEAALLFPTGFAANVGAVTSLVGRGDTVFSDELNHASLIDGCRLSGASIHVYRHHDTSHLAELLQAASGAGRRLIVTDSVFSMNGDVAPLDALAELAEQYEAMLLVDEAHACGVLGHCGRGACEQLAVESRVDLQVGTLSKAFGSLGGYIAGSDELIQWIGNRARTYMFSTAQPEAISAASLAALEIVQADAPRRLRVVESASRLRQILNGLGFNTAGSSTQIIPLIVGDNDRAVAMSRELRNRGFYVPAIRPPAVPNHLARLRISLSSEHTEDQLQRFCDCLTAMSAVRDFSPR